jgi:hypothetical protein
MSLGSCCLVLKGNRNNVPLNDVVPLAEFKLQPKVHTRKTNQIILKPVKECNYCDDEWLKGAAEEDGDEICYVHKDIPHDTAVKLGVPSLTDKLLEFTEGIEEWGQTEPLTRRIHNLLKDYKDGLSVPKEIVQNHSSYIPSQVSELSG